MAAGNTSYTTSDLTAFAIEQVLKKEWTDQTVKACALLACIKDRDLKWNKGYKVSGLKALIPVIMTDIAAFNTSTAGIADANEIPSGWPDYDPTEGFSQAAFEFCHMRRSMTVKKTEKVLAGSGERGNLLQGKIQQLMSKFTTIKGTWIVGNQNGTRQQLLGAEHAIATANTVGGIDQSLAVNESWRGTVTAVGGAIGLSHVNNMYDALGVNANKDGVTSNPDLLALSYVAGGINCYGAVRALIDDAGRFMFRDFKVKYGIDNFEFNGMKCVRENRLASGQALMLNTASWYYGGNEIPDAEEAIRIPGSNAEERMYTDFSFVGCDEIRLNGRLTGITG